MNNSLAVFSFQQQQLRVFGTTEDPWFVAQDVCRLLELGNVSKALNRIDSEDIGEVILSDTIGRLQNYRAINESGLYSLILGSRKEVAKPFKRWGTKEVLPSIRKTGKYEINQQFSLPQTMQEALRLAADEMDKRIAAEQERDRLALQAEENRPHVELGKAIAFSEDSITIGEFAKMIGTGRNRLFAELREMGIIMKNSTIAYQKYVEPGYFEVSQEITPDGKLVPFSMLTGKGQLWLHGKLEKRKELQSKAIAGIVQGVLDMNI